ERATTRPVVSGTQGVVVAGHPLVSMAGMRMLLSGGNAFDAAVAAGFAAAGVEPTAAYTLCGEGVALRPRGRGRRAPAAGGEGPRDAGAERAGHGARRRDDRVLPRAWARSDPDRSGARRASVVHGAGGRRRISHAARVSRYEGTRRRPRASAPVRAWLPHVR